MSGMRTAVVAGVAFAAGAAVMWAQQRGGVEPSPVAPSPVAPNLACVDSLSLNMSSAAPVAGAAKPPAAPTTGRVQLIDNNCVKSWRSTILPNGALTQHRHDHGRALIALTDGQLQVVDTAGKVINTYHWERGKAYWLDADPPGQTHADVNRTTSPIEVIVVELKKDK